MSVSFLQHLVLLYCRVCARSLALGFGGRARVVVGRCVSVYVMCVVRTTVDTSLFFYSANADRPGARGHGTAFAVLAMGTYPSVWVYVWLMDCPRGSVGAQVHTPFHRINCTAVGMHTCRTVHETNAGPCID
jgi:hypothetical protein